MISRREVMAAGMLGSLTAKGNIGETIEQAVEEVAALRQGFRDLNDKLTSLGSTIDTGLRGNSMAFGGVGSVRTKIQEYARTAGKFPEYCDIGLNIFYDVYDWHVRMQQQINITRMADQRIAIQFMFTQLVVRWENDQNFVGAPYTL